MNAEPGRAEHRIARQVRLQGFARRLDHPGSGDQVAGAQVVAVEEREQAEGEDPDHQGQRNPAAQAAAGRVGRAAEQG